MFDEFRPSSSRAARRRLGGSMALAAVLYGALAALVISGTRAATRVVEEELMQVQFAPPPAPENKPEPPPPPENKEQASSPRPKAKRKELKPPDEVPQDKPQESDAPLAAAEPAGPVDGFTDGVEGGRGSASVPPPPPPPPPSKPEPLLAPVPLKSNPAPPYSASARRKEIEGTVVVSFEVLESGSVGNVQVVSGPEELRDSVLKTVATWRFEPARRGGKPVRCRQTKSIQFRLSSV